MDLIKVFIAEDEIIVREGLRDMIPWEKYGFEFVGDAPDGEMALPLIRKLKPDVLITDIKMPFMDGLSLSNIISREFPETKIIIISGYSDFEYARQAIELNVDQYLLLGNTQTATHSLDDPLCQHLAQNNIPIAHRFAPQNQWYMFSRLFFCIVYTNKGRLENGMS